LVNALILGKDLQEKETLKFAREQIPELMQVTFANNSRIEICIRIW
jgi:hypothetical protein